MKAQYNAIWHDATNQVTDTTRERVAYLIRAARSRGATVHRIHHPYHVNYQIGTLELRGSVRENKREAQLRMVRV